MESELEMSLENQIQDLKDRNNELVKEVQYFKMLAAKKENEKLDLMKEMNDMRLRLSKLRNNDTSQTAKMGAAIQSVSEETLSNLVQASSGVARVLELFKTFEQKRQELTLELPKWSSTFSGTPTSEKINKVPPMMIGGRLIQPVVSLSRTLQTNNYRSSSGSQQTRTAASALPMHMLQDVYIPLTRIDAGELPINNVEAHTDVSPDGTAENLSLNEDEEQILDNSQIITESEEYMERLSAVIEDRESAHQPTPRRTSVDPLEGPSWLLDRPSSKKKSKSQKLEPDSTTELNESRQSPGPSGSTTTNTQRHLTLPPVSVPYEFSPTIRKKKCASPPLPITPRVSASPHFSPQPPKRNNGKVLKVLVAKMRLDEDLTDVTPPKRVKEDPRQKNKHKDSQRGESTQEEQTPKKLMQFDAPSPNGSTDSRVIVLEANDEPEPSPILPCRRTVNRINSVNCNKTNQNNDNVTNRTSHNRNTQISSFYNRNQSNQDVNSERQSRDSRDSDSSGSEVASEGRTRRPRKAVVYKEKPLNRKLRR